MTINELVGKIAVRASELADMKIDLLRLTHPEAGETLTETMTNLQGQSRGRLIEGILVEEFSQEFDQELLT